MQEENCLRIKEQDEKHEEDMENLLTSPQSQLDNIAAALYKKIARSQAKIQEMINKSQEAILM